MKKMLIKTVAHPLIKGSIVILIGTLLANVFNFGYNLFMSNSLRPADYGTLASLISLITLATIPASALVPTVVNFAATYFANDEKDKIKGLFHTIGIFIAFVSLFVLMGAFFLSGPIGKFFNIHNIFLIILAAVTVFIGFNSTVTFAFLQARLSFGFISLTNLLGAMAKLILGILLIMVGFSVTGAMWAFLLSFLIPYIISFFPLRFLFDRRATKLHISYRDLISYGLPTTIALLGITSLVTTDIILIKHFWDPKAAGIYSGLSLVGRVIFFLSAPIGTVMFPLITQKHARKENYFNTFLLAVGLVAFSSFCMTLFYFFFPTFIIQFFLKNDEYLITAPFLGLFGLVISLYAILTVFTNFFLSIKKTWVAYPIAIAALLQVGIISIYHENFLQVILISLVLCSLLLLILIVYYTILFLRHPKI